MFHYVFPSGIFTRTRDYSVSSGSSQVPDQTVARATAGHSRAERKKKINTYLGP